MRGYRKKLNELKLGFMAKSDEQLAADLGAITALKEAELQIEKGWRYRVYAVDFKIKNKRFCLSLKCIKEVFITDSFKKNRSHMNWGQYKKSRSLKSKTDGSISDTILDGL